MRAALQEFAPIDTGTSGRRSATAGGMTIAELRFEAGARLPRHAHELATITVTLEGAFETALQTRSYENPLHTVLAKPAGEAHSNAFGNSGVRLLMLSLDDASDEFCCCRQAFQSILHVVDVRTGALAMALASELAAPDDLTPLALAGLSREVLALAARLREVRRELPRPLWLRRGLDFVQANLQSPIGLRQLSGVCGVHPIYFARAFRAHTGESLGRYVRKLRVQRAAAMLGGSTEPIAGIALSLGFSDQSHLTRVFRAVTGYTPGSYRRLCSDS
jgi:AraC family transcriptional regulator